MRYMALSALFSFFSKRFRKQPVDQGPIITITDDGITCIYPSLHKTDAVLWNELTKIDVLTTDDGPAVCDVIFMLYGTNGNGVAIPQDRPESKVVVDKILNLPGFDYECFINAMGSADNQLFHVWKKKEN